MPTACFRSEDFANPKPESILTFGFPEVTIRLIKPPGRRRQEAKFERPSRVHPDCHSQSDCAHLHVILRACSFGTDCRKSAFCVVATLLSSITHKNGMIVCNGACVRARVCVCLFFRHASCASSKAKARTSVCGDAHVSIIRSSVHALVPSFVQLHAITHSDDALFHKLCIVKPALTILV